MRINYAYTTYIKISPLKMANIIAHKTLFYLPIIQNQNLRTSALFFKHHSLFKQIHLRNFFANLTEQPRELYANLTEQIQNKYETNFKIHGTKKIN
ncbi:hypothetical protein M667_04680 [Cellulophaga baltica NN016038]|nr:hypothetical protein M667_04680 [Cellulophaga baltica NN016038]